MHNLQDHQLFRLSACRQSLTLGHSQHQPQARFSYNQQATTAFPNHPQGTCFTQPHAVNFQQQEHAIGYTLPGQLARFPQPVFKELEQAVDFQQQFYQTGTVLQHEVAGFLGRFEMEEQAARFKQQGQAARFIQQEQGARFIQQEQAPRFIQQEQGARFKQQEQGARFIQQEHGTRFIQQEQGARLKQQEQAARLKQQEQGARFKQQEQAPRLKQHYAVQDPTFETFSREHPPSIFHPPILSPPPCADPSMHYHQYDSVEYAISILENMSKHSHPGLKDQCLLSVFEDPNPSNEFPDGLIAEMTSMDKDDFESLLLGTSVAPTTSTSLVPPLDVVCHADNALVSSLMSDCDQAMSPVESAFATSVSTTPTMSPSLFSYSPSSESGYEDDCEQDGGISRQANAWMECDDTPALADLLKNNTAFLPEAKTSQQESTIQRACEELQKLIASTCNSTVQMPATVASVSTQAASPTLPSYTQNGLVSAPLSTTIGLATTSDPMDITRNHLSVPSADKTAICEPKLVLLEEPEENYRARYESEGCRGPIHGSSDNTFPTVKVLGYSGSVWITVHLVTSSGQPHYHSIHGPGSTKVPCKEFLLPGEIPAVQVLVEPDCDMTAILDSLSIRRLRNWEGDKELKKRGIDPRTWKKERKEARLLFQADIPAKDGLPEMKLSCKSRIFQCSSSGATGNPEIWWTSRTEGCVEGGEELGLIGKKFPTGFKVRFSANLPSGKVWEALVDCDKNKSHQGAGVICTPPFFDLNIMSPMRVNLEVLSTSKNAKCSDPVEFTYQPRPHNSAIANVSACLSTPGQDSIAQGGFVTALQGGTTITTLPSCSKLINCTATPMQPCVVPAQTKESDETDWQRIIVQLKELHQKGEITTQNIKDLCVCIQNKDLLLLQAFRSAKNAGTIEECQLKFKQYLSHLLEVCK